MANNDNKKVGFKLAGLKKLLKTIKDDINSKEPALPAKINSKYLHTDSSGNLEWSEVDLSAKEDVANKTDSYQVSWEKWSVHTITTHTDVIEDDTPLMNTGSPVYVSSAAPTIKPNGKFDTSGFEMMYAYQYDNYERQVYPYLLLSQASESDFYYYITSVVDMGGWYEYHDYKHVVQTTTTQEKGATQYADVSSTNVNAYPQNDAQDGYWYVFKASSYGSTEYTSKKALIDGLGTKQSTLVSGVNIKTLNNNSILGEGNLDIVPNIVGTSDPTTSTAGCIGQLYTNTTTNIIFQCTAISGSTYTWTMVGGASKEDVTNKVTSITSASTNIQYPSALATYTAVNAKEDKGMITVDGTEYVAKSLFCNRNLLDNPWFTVNQRNASGLIEVGSYFADRWYARTGGCTINNEVVTGAFGQVLNLSFSALANQTLTLSILLTDGTTVTKSGAVGTIPSEPTSYIIGTTGDVEYDFWYYPTVGNFRLDLKTTTSAIKAIKLELNSISTLANDTAPNYTEELQKCKYYFERYHCDGYGVVGTLTRYVTTFEVPFVYECSKRIAPSFSVVGTYVALYSSSATNVTFRAAGSVNRNSAILEFNGSTVCSTGYIRANNASGSYIDISADL